MADPNLGQTIASSWEAVVGTKPEDNISDDYYVLRTLEKAGTLALSGGRTINGPIAYALNSTVQAYSDTDQISTTRVDVFDEFQYDWAEYAGTVVISELEKAKNAGEGQKFALLPAKLENLRTSMRSTINSDILGTASGKEMLGFQDLIPATTSTNTVGGISRASFSFWNNQSVAGTQTTSAYDNLRAAMRNCYNSCSQGMAGQHPTNSVTTQTVFEGYEGLLIANERFVKKGTGEGAFDTLQFKGAEIAYDNDCLSASLYFFNPKFLKLVYKKGRWFRGRAPVNPANQTVDIFLVDTMCQLITNNARRLGIVNTIT
jgi:hypothetical protein